MTITLADLPAEFAAVDETLADMWIAVAVATIETRRWACAGVDPDTGVKLLASHLIKSDPDSGLPAPAGLTTSKTIGGVSVTTEVGSAVKGPHGSTPYGRAYDALLARVKLSRRTHLPPPPQPAC